MFPPGHSGRPPTLESLPLLRHQFELVHTVLEMFEDQSVEATVVLLAMTQRDDECVVVMASKCVEVDVDDDSSAARNCAVSEGGRCETKILSKLMTDIKLSYKHS